MMFYPTLGFGVLSTTFTSRNWFDRVDETVVVGALPFRSVTQKLIKEENIKGMVTMNEDYEMKYLTYDKEELSSLGVTQLHLRTTDLTGTPSQADISTAVDFITEHKQRGDCVYVHCKAGRTRSVTVAVCYLMQTNKWTPEQSLEFIKSKRPHVWLREKQMTSVQQYYDTHVR